MSQTIWSERRVLYIEISVVFNHLIMIPIQSVAGCGCCSAVIVHVTETPFVLTLLTSVVKTLYT